MFVYMGISQVNISLFIIVAFLGDRGGGLANCRPRRPPSFPLVTREELVAGLGQPVFPPSATLPAVVEEVLLDHAGRTTLGKCDSRLL